MLDNLKNSNNRIVGTKQVTKAIEAGQVTTVYLAGDADVFIKNKIICLCEQSNVNIVNIPTMSQLGEACGISVGSATAAVKDN